MLAANYGLSGNFLYLTVVGDWLTQCARNKMYLAREYRRMTDVIFSVAIHFVSVCQITSIIRFFLDSPNIYRPPLVFNWWLASLEATAVRPLDLGGKSTHDPLSCSFFALILSSGRSISWP